MSSSEPPPVEVLYVGGFTRSGSTLLAYLLGAVDGFQPVGELREVWTKGVLGDNLCSCGEPFSSCPFWSSVGEHAFGGWDNVDAEELAAASAALGTQMRLVPALIARRRLPPRLERLGEQAALVYRAIAETSGCEVVVDSSKHASYALLLSRQSAVQLRVVHLVRDSRGVAFSWGKRDVRKPDVDGPPAVMDSYGAAATALRWDYHNELFSTLRLRGVQRTVLRYERLAAAPAAGLELVLGSLGFGAGLVSDRLTSGSVELTGAHTIGGNPMRFGGRAQPVRVDEAWRGAMSVPTRAAVTLLTLPLLVRYGYVRTPLRREVRRGVPPAGVALDG